MLYLDRRECTELNYIYRIPALHEAGVGVAPLVEAADRVVAVGEASPEALPDLASVPAAEEAAVAEGEHGQEAED